MLFSSDNNFFIIGLLILLHEHIHSSHRIGKKMMPFYLYIYTESASENSGNKEQKRRTTRKKKEEKQKLFFSNFFVFHVICHTVGENIVYIKTE